MSPVAVMAEPELDLVGLGERVAQRRRRLHLEQADVADRAGLSPAYVSRLERGRIIAPKITDLRSIARALDVTLDDLINDRPSSRLTPDDEAELQALLRRPEFLPDFAAFLDGYDAASEEDRRRLLAAFRVLASRHRFN